MTDIVADIIDTKGGERIRIDAPFVYKDRITAIPGSKYDKKTLVWSVPLSWQSCLALRSTFGDALTLGRRLTDWATVWRGSRVDPALALKAATEAEGYPDLYPHQRADVAFLLAARRAFLCNEPGLGKTAASISTLRRFYELGENPFPLLVITLNSAKYSWKKEIERVWPGLKVTVLDGTPAQKRKSLKAFSGGIPCVLHGGEKVSKKKNPECTCPGHVLVVNYEALSTFSRLESYGSTALKKCVDCGGSDPKVTVAKCQVHRKELNEIEFRSAIADESHRLKDPTSGFSRAAKAAVGDADIRIALTGTPVANHPGDLWSQLNWLDPVAYPSRTKYIDRFLDVSYPIFGGIEILGIKPGMEAEFFGGLDPMLRRMTKKSAGIKLPPKIYKIRECEMSPKQKKAYQELEKGMVTIMDSGKLLLADSKMNQRLKLLQLASAYGEVEEKTFIDKEGNEQIRTNLILSEPSAKLDAFMEDIEGFEEQSVAVFCPSKQVINLLAARMDKAGIPYARITGDESASLRQQHMDAFQQGRVKFVLCTTGAGGTAITLTKASIQARIGRSWSSIEDTQAEDRTHRIGSEQHESILYIDYITKGTVEEKVLEALDKKERSLQEILKDDELWNKILNDEEQDDS